MLANRSTAEIPVSRELGWSPAGWLRHSLSECFFFALIVDLSYTHAVLPILERISLRILRSLVIRSIDFSMIRLAE